MIEYFLTKSREDIVALIGFIQLSDASGYLDDDIIGAIKRLIRFYMNMEDAHNDGRLIFLPCKMGDTVWMNRYYHSVLKAQSGVVSGMYFNNNMELIIEVKYVGRGKFGKKVFLTREDAEAAMVVNLGQ